MSELLDQVSELLSKFGDKVIVIVPTQTQKLKMGSIHEGPEPDARIEQNAQGEALLHLRLPRGKDSIVPGPQGPAGSDGESIVGPAGRSGRDGKNVDLPELIGQLETRLRDMWKQDIEAALRKHDLEKRLSELPELDIDAQLRLIKQQQLEVNEPATESPVTSY